MEPRSATDGDGLNRREFIRISLISSALLAGSGELLNAQAPDAAHAALVPHAVLHPLPPGAVEPQGWLRKYMEKQAAHLGSKLPEISVPFTGAYWAGEEQAESWWPWEQKGYWLDGATRLAIVLRDDRLLAQTAAVVNYTLSHADAQGYLGPEYFRSPKDLSCSRWPQTVFFRALAAAGDAHASAVSDIGEAMRNHYLGDHISYGTPARNVTNIEGMLWCYGRTGDNRLLSMAEETWREYMTIAEDDEHGGLTPSRVYADTPIECHGVTYIEIAKQPAILYLYTGKEEYRQFAIAAMRRVLDHHMLIDGIPSTAEFYRTTTATDTHETCDIADHMWSWGYMLMATGDSSWADLIERACFNAAPGAIRNDWKALQYFSSPNQFLATLSSDQSYPSAGGSQMAYQPNPGHAVACCAGNVHRIFPNYVIRMWMQSNDGGLAAVFYGPSKLAVFVPAAQQTVEIIQSTSYPFNDHIHLTINCHGSIEFPLHLRIPTWCDSPLLKVNGRQVDITRDDNGFVTLSRRFHSGDEVELTFPMKLAISRWPQSGMGIEYGPLVYSLPILEEWKSVVVPRYSTEEYPAWEATPASAWNYGLAIDPEKLKAQVEISTKEGPVDDPWENPLTTLMVPFRKIEKWDLLDNPEKPGQKFTPPLPNLRKVRASDTVERLILVPYGSTHLRMTIFPLLRG